MKHWDAKRKASLIVHASIVTVPFLASTVSALLLWHALFGSWWLAVPPVLVIEVLALLGLVLFICGVPSPFHRLRHLLPLISIIPLGRELYLLLQHNGVLLAGVVTAVLTALAVALTWQCFRTIEQLWSDPIEAARELARARVASLDRTLAELREMNAVAEAFARSYAHDSMTVTDSAVPALPVAGDSAVLECESALPSAPSSKTAQVRALARALQVSESTIWRRASAGDIVLE